MQRFLTNGLLDSSFGDNGKVYTTFDFGGGRIYNVSVLPEGKILAAGYGAAIRVRYVTPVIIKYLQNGSLDSSFGINGVASANTNALKGVDPRVMQVMTDGRIVQAGDNGLYTITILRYAPNGSLDSSFGVNGMSNISITGFDKIYSLVVQSDDKIVVGGESYEPGQLSNFIMARLTEKGKLDSCFGINGRRVIDFYKDEDGIRALALQPDGKIVAVGRVDQHGLGTPIMTVTRFKTDGYFDSSFGTNGVVFCNFHDNSSVGNTVAIQSNGYITAGGYSNLLADTNKTFCALVQLKPDGTYNTSFGDSGKVKNDFGYFNQIVSLNYQGNGKIIAASSAYSSHKPYNNLILTRYNNGQSKQQQIITKIKHYIQNHHNGITWDNVPEASNYVVERSVDNIYFTAISNININSLKTHFYEDSSATAPNNYYRVQTTNSDGMVTHSNTVVIQTAVVTSKINIYPNPVKDMLHIKNLNSSLIYKLSVSSEAGITILSAEIKKVSEYNYNTQRLSQGIYHLTLNTKNENAITYTFVKE